MGPIVPDSGSSSEKEVVAPSRIEAVKAYLTPKTSFLGLKTDQNVDRVSEDLKIVPAPLRYLHRKEKQDNTNRKRRNSTSSPNDLSLRECLVLIGRWLTADNIVFLLSILSLLPIGFIIGIVAWANQNPGQLCVVAPRLSDFYNGLFPAFITIIPGCAVVLFLFPTYCKTQRTLQTDEMLEPASQTALANKAKCAWTRPRIFTMVLLIAGITVLTMLWTLEWTRSENRLNCGPYLGYKTEQPVLVSSQNFTDFCNQFWKMNAEQFKSSEQEWSKGPTVHSETAEDEGRYRKDADQHDRVSSQSYEPAKMHNK